MRHVSNRSRAASMALLITDLRRIKHSEASPGVWTRKCFSNTIQMKLLLLLVIGFLIASIYVLYIGHSSCAKKTDHVNNMEVDEKTDRVKNTEVAFETDRNLAQIVAAASSLLPQRPLLVTFINDGYLPMTYNWLCHTKHLPSLHSDVLVLTDSESTRTQLQRSWPAVRSEVMPGPNVSLAGSLVFSTAGYLRLMALRTRALNELLRNGFSFVLFETDFIWFDNPVPDFLALASKDDLDIVGSKPAANDLICGAFIYFRNTPRTRDVWAEVTRQMSVLETRIKSLDTNRLLPEGEHEQAYLSNLLKHRFHGVRYGLVDYHTSVADGKWYTMDDAKRESIRPKALHNNWIRTNTMKVQRFQEFGQWVLKADNSCDDDKVNEMMSSWFKRN